MIKKTITFEDLEGNDVTEDFYFHISRAEVIQMNLEDDGLKERLEAVAASNDNKLIFNTFKDIVLAAVGVKSEDGRSFIKTDEIRSHFENSDAFIEFVFDLMQEDGAAAAFIKGALPSNLGKRLPGEVVNETPVAIEEPVGEPTDEELRAMHPREMTREQLVRAMALKTQ